MPAVVEADEDLVNQLVDLPDEIFDQVIHEVIDQLMGAEYFDLSLHEEP